MALSHGMNIEEVERIGALLQNHYAAQMQQMAAEVEGMVSSTSGAWIGPDAERFRSWWPAKRSMLRSVADDLSGFGQSALNNAAEQRTASGEGGSSSLLAGSPGGPAPGGGTPNPDHLAHPHVEPPGAANLAPGGTLPDAPGALRDEFVREWKPVNGQYDSNNFFYNEDGNCVSYVAWRLNDLAEETGADWSMSNNHIGGEAVPGNRLGNAYEWGNNATAAGYPPDQNPTAGSVAWWDVGDGKGSYGHVGVVRSVAADGTITVEESSWGSSVFEVKTYRPGQAGYPGGFIHLMPGT